MYNLTAQTNHKKGYCAIWTEVTSGRAGNDIASAFVSILRKIVEDNPAATDLICWSDSCVPQNRNSHISQAILEFLFNNKHMKSITMKYSITGPSCVQEVDNMHKQIEDDVQVAEFYSPISFLRLLLKANRKDPYHVIQMKEHNFKDFMISSKLLHYNLVPYQKLLQLKFEQQNLHELKFKFSHGDTEFQTINIGRHASAARRSKTASVVRYPVQVMEE